MLFSCRVPKECPQEVAELIDRCCSGEAENRPSASDIVHFMAEQLELMDTCMTREDGPCMSGRAIEVDYSASIEQGVSSTSLVSSDKSVFTRSSLELSKSNDLLLEDVCERSNPRSSKSPHKLLKTLAKGLLHALERSWESSIVPDNLQT